MLIQLSGKDHLYRQIYQALRSDILSGALKPGEQLPATRQLASDLGVSRNVVLLAYEQLRAEGYAEARVGAGTFVVPQLPGVTPPASREESRGAPERPPLSAYARRAVEVRPGSPYAGTGAPRYDFRYGLIAWDETLQIQWRRTLSRAAGRFPLNYGEVFGYYPLREALAVYLKRRRGVSCAPEQILITNGSQQALDLVTRALLTESQRVLIEEPHYQGARQAFLAAGARLVPATVDAEGLRLPEPRPRAQLAYVTPSHQFPKGAVMSLARRLELLEWARTCGAYILEDDYDSEYRYEGRPVAAIGGLDQDGRVIYMGTFSKVLFPALRLGFLVLPTALIEPFQAVKWLSDRHSATLEQVALARFIDEGLFERHLRRVRSRNARRRAALLRALAALEEPFELEGSNAGVHLLLWLERFGAAEQTRLCERALNQGVGLYPVAPYYLEPPPRVGLLFGYAALTEADIGAGIDRLAAVLAGKSQAGTA